MSRRQFADDADRLAAVNKGRHAATNKGRERARGARTVVHDYVVVAMTRLRVRFMHARVPYELRRRPALLFRATMTTDDYYDVYVYTQGPFYGPFISLVHGYVCIHTIIKYSPVRNSISAHI